MSPRGLTGVEREGVLREADLRVGMTQLDLLGRLQHKVAVCTSKRANKPYKINPLKSFKLHARAHKLTFIAQNWVLHDTVMARGHCNHLLRPEDNLLIVLADEGHGTNLRLPM